MERGQFSHTYKIVIVACIPFPKAILKFHFIVRIKSEIGPKLPKLDPKKGN